MRIAIFTNNYLPNPYGVSGSIESFRKEFEKLGHTVYVFAPRAKGYVDENSKACLSGRQVFRYPAIDLKFKDIRFPIPIPFSFGIGKILKNLEIDVIHSQHPNLLGWAARRWAKKKNVPLVFTWHTLYDRYAHFAPLVPEKISAWWTIRNAVNYANAADQIIVPTLSVRDIIRAWGVVNAEVEAIPTGVEDLMYENPDPAWLAQQCGFSENSKVLLLHSRLTEEKNVLFVVRSVAKVLKKKTDTVFVISGRGAELEKIRSEVSRLGISQQTFFIDPQNKEVLKNIYAGADIFVYGSKSETQGMVISEAMYSGVSVVAVLAPGVRDLVANQINGLLVKENEDAFACAVAKLLDDDVLLMRFSDNARSIARENYSSEVCAKKMLKTYEKIIRKRRSNSA